MADNISRAQIAEQALDNTRDGEMGEELECEIIDLITNLLHLADAKGLDTDVVANMARMHFEEEKND